MATKIFDHAVIYNGVFYPANTPIEDKNETKTVSKEEIVETPKKPAKKGGAKNDSETD